MDKGSAANTANTAGTVKFGLIGCGLMGREFASASLRWLHLQGGIPRPAIVAACDLSDANLAWFKRDPDTRFFYSDYRQLLQNQEVEAVYCAVPHHLHGAVYSDAIRAKKHLLGEKPFGMDAAGFARIQAAMRENPDVFVRVASEFPFYPAAWQMARWYAEGAFGTVIEANFSIRHSSDMDLSKPINWKRTLVANGEYGCMGDLGIHTQHLPFRLGLWPQNVAAQLSNIAKTRPGPDGAPVACETWDNAVLLCRGKNAAGDEFPMRFEMKRMAPGCANTVEYEILGLKRSARFTTDDANALHCTDSVGPRQAWARLPVGQDTVFPAITGSIFEFGFSDSLLQMFAAFVSELRGLPCPFGCFTPAEAARSHQLLAAALKAHREQAVIPLAIAGRRA
ncbi:MAG: Gfo/Idh/MocA family oxidoreductase [Clostridiales bacterium]|jgi:predicted dehydrogenase|nr:Gfo/Idh/MocA family oxidoreductase [Clostridiales bacterium]